jgi:phage terminase small subunit
MKNETDKEKEIKKHLSQKQIDFVLYWIETSNITQSAIRAGYSAKTASAQGCRLLKQVRIQEYISAIRERLESDKIASIEEVMQYLTRVMRGEEKDSFDMEPSLQERTKAANALADRLDVRAKNINVQTAVTIIDDIPDDVEVEDVSEES